MEEVQVIHLSPLHDIHSLFFVTKTSSLSLVMEDVIKFVINWTES